MYRIYSASIEELIDNDDWLEDDSEKKNKAQNTAVIS